MAKKPQSLRRADDLIAAGLVPAGDRAALERVAARYAVAITPGLAGCIDSNDPGDPVGRQFIPDPRELDISELESALLARAKAPLASGVSPPARST